MAGIGFTLKKLFRDETYTNRSKAYLYSAFVAAGPWIAAVITVNILLFIMDFVPDHAQGKDLFLGTIVYSFVFSQIVTTPWQFIITRYISDKLYSEEYDFIRPSFVGLNKIIFIIGSIAAVAFYWNKPLPIYYKILAVYLFIIITMIWIVMVYLSAVKNYELIAKAYMYGGFLSIGLTILFLYYPLQFPSLTYATTFLLTYVIGLSLTIVMLVYNFLSTFYFGNHLEYNFLRYLSKVPSLFLIGLFYTLGLWVDDIIMWFSIAGVQVYETYNYAPIYDNAVFLAYLTTIPTMVLFMVSVETEFYDTYKKYYGLVNKFGTYSEIDQAKDEMKKTIYGKLIYTFQVQALISVTIVLLSRPIFHYLNFSIIVRNIFRVCAFGALFNIFILLIILVLLYFESRKRALLISFLFFVSNLILTDHYVVKGLEYYGYGFTLGALIALLVAIVFLSTFMRRLNFTTFASQPFFAKEENGIFVRVANLSDQYKTHYFKEKGIVIGRKIKITKMHTNIGIALVCILLYTGGKFMDVSTQKKLSVVLSEEISSLECENEEEIISDSEMVYVQYTLKAGETLYSVSMKFYNSEEMIEEIKELNEIEDVYAIPVGKVLKLPQNIDIRY